jgi:hypothetical protein
MSQTVQQATAQIGGRPTVGVDIPICAVLIALFIPLAASHMTILQRNRKRGHKFIFNGLCFGFAMSRIAANVLRLVWATRPKNADVALVAAVFLNAGILLVYIINNLLAWRIVRASIPNIGWNKGIRVINRIMLWGVLGLIIPLIVVIILRVKQPTLPHIMTASTVLTRLAQTYFLIIAIEPAILLPIAYIKSRNGPTDPFGKGSWNSKFIVLGISTTLALIEAGFRCGTTWAPAPLASNPAWWDHKAAFYCFNFMIDIFILATFLVGRIDRRFWVPNGAEGPGSYSRGMEAERADLEK